MEISRLPPLKIPGSLEKPCLYPLEISGYWEKNHVSTPWKFPWPNGNIQEVTKTLLARFFPGGIEFSRAPRKKNTGGLLISLWTWGAPPVQWPEISFSQGDFSVHVFFFSKSIICLFCWYYCHNKPCIYSCFVHK